MAQAAMDETLYELSERLPYEINLKPEQREWIMNLLNTWSWCPSCFAYRIWEKFDIPNVGDRAIKTIPSQHAE